MRDRFFIGLCAIFFGAYAIGYLTACGGGAMQTARTTLTTAARVSSAVDGVAAASYRRAAQRCLDIHLTAEGYAACRAPHDRILEAIVVTRGALLTAEQALDAYEAGESGSIADAFPCAADALASLLEVLDAAHVNVSEDIRGAIALLRALAPGTCRAE